MKRIGRNILAYFTRREQAEEARARLRQAGYDPVEIDRISRYGGDDTQSIHNPLTGDFGSLAQLTAGADVAGDDDAAALLAADPGASGLASGGDVGVDLDERAWVLTVVTTEDQANRAVQILEDAGGSV